MNTSKFLTQIDTLQAKISEKWGITLMRYALAIIYIWFGILKPFGMSPAGDLVAHTVFWFSSDWFLPLLGLFETMIGVLLLFKPTTRLAILMIYLHLPGTFLPFLTFPESTVAQQAFELTLEGQYIVKNLAILVIAITIGGAFAKSAEKTVEAKPTHEANYQREYNWVSN